MPETAIQTYHGSYLMPSLEHATVSDAMHPGILSCEPDATATEVARLTMVLEGPASPIGAILAQDNARADASSKRPARAAAAEGVNGNLADRIRALQARVSRASPPPT